MKHRTNNAHGRLTQEVAHELKDHKQSFLVFSILRFLVIVVLVRQIMLQSYQSAFLCILTLLLLYVPSWIQIKLRIELPQPMEITVLCFIFAAEILGEVNAFYVVIPGWDTVLHTINGFLAAAVGFSLVLLLNKNKHAAFALSPCFLALVAFCFSMTVGVVWEFLEFGADWFLHTDAQKDTVIHAIHSVALDPTRSNQIISIENIVDTAVNGQSLELDGYLDIGLIDTMKDLLVNFLGAAVFSLIGFFFISGNHALKTIVASFVPRVKLGLGPERDSAAVPEAREDGPTENRKN